MVGAYLKLNGYDPQRVIVLKVDGWRARVRVVDGMRPFTEYGAYPMQIYYSHTGWVAKSRLFGLRSSRISEGAHAHTVARKPAEVLKECAEVQRVLTEARYLGK